MFVESAADFVLVVRRMLVRHDPNHILRVALFHFRADVRTKH